MNVKKLVVLTIFSLNIFIVFGQNSKLKITPLIKLPFDSLVKTRLIQSIEMFLIDKNLDLNKSKVVESNHYKQNIDFFDLLKNIEKSKKYNDTLFFKCYLKNVVLQPNKDYKIDLSYYGIAPNNEVINRLNFSLIARPFEDLFKFYCPFEENTKNWKSKKIGNIEFFYENNIDLDVAEDFEKYNSAIAKKFNLTPIQFKFYKCKDIQEVYKILGVDYDITRNGEMRSGSFDISNKVFLAGTNTDQYKHDLTHTYIGVKYPDSLRNWTAEEGYNIYTTDFWGESSEQIFKYLRDFITSYPDSSLIKAFEKDIYLKYPIPIKYPLAAILVRKVERELGFTKVLELISCGEKEELFFVKLEQLTGITKSTFDQVIKEELRR